MIQRALDINEKFVSAGIYPKIMMKKVDVGKKLQEHVSVVVGKG